MEGPYLRELNKPGVVLRFGNRRVENEYQAYAAGRHSVDLRVQLLFGGLLICIISLFDYMLLEPQYASTAILLRLGLMLPPIVLMILLTYRPGARRFLQPAGVLVALAFGLGSLLIGAQGNSFQSPQIFGGFQIIVVFIYFFLGLRVGTAIGTATMLFAAFVVTLVFTEAPMDVLAYGALYLLFLNVIGALGCYQLSKARRTVFLEERVLSYRANHDGLTQLPNRRAFDELFEAAWDNAQTMGKPVALLMMDIDHFKSYNDLYGHQAGDHAIAAVASILEKNLNRPQDFAGRYGGEEFVVLLFDSTREFALELAERIREQVLGKNIEHRGSSVARSVSVSIGVAYVNPSRSTRSMQGFVQMADEALYAAKEQGRNCVVDADLSVHSTTTGIFRVMQLDSDEGIDEALELSARS